MRLSSRTIAGPVLKPNLSVTLRHFVDDAVPAGKDAVEDAPAAAEDEATAAEDAPGESDAASAQEDTPADAAQDAPADYSPAAAAGVRLHCINPSGRWSTTLA